jgi:hypothetical protein
VLVMLPVAGCLPLSMLSTADVLLPDVTQFTTSAYAIPSVEHRQGGDTTRRPFYSVD